MWSHTYTHTHAISCRGLWPHTHTQNDTALIGGRWSLKLLRWVFKIFLLQKIGPKASNLGEREREDSCEVSAARPLFFSSVCRGCKLSKQVEFEVSERRPAAAGAPSASESVSVDVYRPVKCPYWGVKLGALVSGSIRGNSRQSQQEINLVTMPIFFPL